MILKGQFPVPRVLGTYIDHSVDQDGFDRKHVPDHHMPDHAPHDIATTPQLAIRTESLAAARTVAAEQLRNTLGIPGLRGATQAIFQAGDGAFWVAPLLTRIDTTDEITDVHLGLRALLGMSEDGLGAVGSREFGRSRQ